MATIKLYHHGISGGVPPGKNDHLRALRDKVQGWSATTIRSNTRFLYSVIESQLTGWGFAITLTVRDCPPDHAAWVRLRQAYILRLIRRGMIRMHWVTEWQRRGVPHLHGAVWFPAERTPGDRYRLEHWLKSTWVDVAREYMAMTQGQHVGQITDFLGWSKYLAKHASRGLSHYQRSPEGVPKGWERTGRMWGYRGSWERLEPVELRIDKAGWFAFRRLVRSARIAEARASGDRRRISQARRMLRSTDRPAAEVRGLSEWMEGDLQDAILRFLREAGFEINHVESDDE